MNVNIVNYQKCLLFLLWSNLCVFFHMIIINIYAVYNKMHLIVRKLRDMWVHVGVCRGHALL